VNRWHVLRAAQLVRVGGVIAYPTEAVYGLGCDPRREVAVRRLLSLKRRSPAKGLILVADGLRRLNRFMRPLPEDLARRVCPTWPGPVTWLVPARSSVPRWLRGCHGTVAVRVTAHPLCRALCRAAGTALVSTSANRAGKAPATCPAEVRRAFGRGVDYVLAGDLGGLTTPTQIRDARTGRVVRRGSNGEVGNENA
jgi:L-threonylcarbamoyladenylate synthase